MNVEQEAEFVRMAFAEAGFPDAKVTVEDDGDWCVPLDDGPGAVSEEAWWRVTQLLASSIGDVSRYWCRACCSGGWDAVECEALAPALQDCGLRRRSRTMPGASDDS